MIAGEGRRSRSRFDADQSWWQRIEVTEDRKADCLRFVTTADRARAERVARRGQLRWPDPSSPRPAAAPPPPTA